MTVQIKRPSMLAAIEKERLRRGDAASIHTVESMLNEYLGILRMERILEAQQQPRTPHQNRT